MIFKYCRKALNTLVVTKLAKRTSVERYCEISAVDHIDYKITIVCECRTNLEINLKWQEAVNAKNMQFMNTAVCVQRAG